MKLEKHLGLALSLGLTCVVACTTPNDPTPTSEGTIEVLLATDVEWEALNPARGDASPRAGTLWGDRKADVATGFLVEFVDGFSSPPHVHNVSYRGVVLEGLVHNDDPDAAPMWMPAGSFWTQPKGEVHVTSAKGSKNVAYIEIEKGPYLVLPTEEAFDSGERPVNVDVSNLVWLDPPGAEASVAGPELAHLWGSPQAGRGNGTLLRLPPGFSGAIRSRGADLRVVVIQGRLRRLVPGGAETQSLEPGSFLGSKGAVLHRVSVSDSEEALLYVRTKGTYEVTGW